MNLTAQRHEAARRGHATISRRAEIRRALWTGSLPFSELDLTDPALSNVPVLDLLALVHRNGHAVKRTPRRPSPGATAYRWAEQILDRFEAFPHVRCGSLSPVRQQQLRDLVTASDPTAHETPGASSEEPRAHLSSPGARPASPKVGIGAGVSSGRAAA